MKPAFNPADRTYQVSDERLRAFKALTPAQRLQWVEELAYFLRLAKVQNSEHPDPSFPRKRESSSF